MNKITQHACAVIIKNTGVLITGPENTGKSELLLGLVDRGHTFISDDATCITRIQDDLFISAPDAISNKLLIRDIGCLDMAKLYGNTAANTQTHLQLIITLTKNNISLRSDLTPYQQTQKILGIDVPKVLIKLSNTRDLPLIVEVLVKDHLVRHGKTANTTRETADAS